MVSGAEDSHPDPSIITRDDGETIAYHALPGEGPGVVFLTGFKSDMTGGKALAIEDYCRSKGRAFLRFDYQGHGQSSGEFADGTIGRWADDAIFAIDKLTTGPQVLVGSSMGGWIMLLAALARPARIAGLVGIAAAPDFTEDLIPDRLTDDQKAALARDGFCEIPNCYDDQEPYRIEQRFLDEGRNNLVLTSPLTLDMPVRLIHGQCDEDVPWQTSLRIAETLTTDDVEVQLVKAGGHRLSEPEDLDRLCRTLDRLLANLG